MVAPIEKEDVLERQPCTGEIGELEGKSSQDSVRTREQKLDTFSMMRKQACTRMTTISSFADRTSA